MAVPALLAPIIAGASSILGGIFGKSAQEKANEANLQAARETNTYNYIIADRANQTQERLNQRNIDLQKEFAQMGLRWKVADAQAAGIHPLAAMGAQTIGFSPVEVGQNVPTFQQPPPAIPEDGAAIGLANAGQDVARALDAARTNEMRNLAAGQTMTALAIQRAGLENQLLASKIAVVKQGGGLPPAQAFDQRYLVTGQGQTQLPTVEDVPLQRNSSAPGRPFEEGGAVTELGWLRAPNDRYGSRYSPVRSADAAQRMEDDPYAGLSFAIRNQLLPALGLNINPPPNQLLRPGHVWAFDPLQGVYHQRPMYNANEGPFGTYIPGSQLKGDRLRRR